MRIGDLATQCGLNPKTIRYYESFGLLPEPARTFAGHRVYSTRDLRRLRFIRRATQIGLPLASIRQIASFIDSGSCMHLRPRLDELIARQLTEIETRIGELAALRRELRTHLASLRRDASTPPEDAECKCLNVPSRNKPALPASALVKRPPRRRT